jgi:hypothetical protein
MHIERILSRLESNPSKLRTTRLAAGFIKERILYTPTDWHPELSTISKFDLHIDAFEYEVKGLEHLCKERVKNVPAWRIVQDTLAKEIERVKNKWAGEKWKLEAKMVKKRELHVGMWRSTLDWKFTDANRKALMRIWQGMDTDMV